MARGTNKPEAEAGADGSVRIAAGVLAKAMKHAAGVVESRNTIPILSNVLLRAEGDTLELASSDLDVEFRQRLPLEKPGAIATTVDARRLAALCTSVAADAAMTLEMDGPRLVVKAGRSRWTLPALPAADFPQMAFDADGAARLTVEPANRLGEALGRVVWAVSTELIKPYLHGPLLHAEQGRAVLAACDGFVLVRAEIGVEHPADAPEVILGPKFCRLLQGLAEGEKGPAQLAWDAGKIRAEIGDRVVVAKHIEGTFPDYRRLLPGESVRVVVEPESLRAALRRTMLVAAAKSRGVKIERGAVGLVLSVTDPDGGAACEEVPADAEGAFTTGFNGRYLDRMLEAIGGDSVEIHQADPGCPALVRRVVPDGAIGVVMPMRV